MVEDTDIGTTSTNITQPTSITVIPIGSTNVYVKIIEDLYTKYKNYPYVLHRLNIHIENLPATLEQEAENYEKRQNRNALLNSEQKTFVQVFLKKHQYFYHATNNTFFEYDNKHYSKIKEDDILYNLLTGISKDDILIQWKYKTKANVIKIIKERNLLKSIPETYTIQRVLKFLSPSIFKTKNETKYFLTILGDNILKKKNSNIYLTNSSTKKLLNEIDNLGSMFLGLNNVNGNFITKYHENNDYENYRLINTVDSISVEFIQEIIKKLGLDLLCVASHYSTRYTNSDNFLETKIEDELKNRVLFLKMNTPKTIIDAFCEQYIEQLSKMGGTGSDCTMTIASTIASTSDNTYHVKKMNYSITWKNMHFIWKKFLSNMGMPNIIFFNTIKNILKERFEYDETNDTFYDVTSKYLPVVSEFIKFWDETIIYDIEFNDLVVTDGNGSLQITSPFCSPVDYYLLNTYNPDTPNTNIVVSTNVTPSTNEFTNELEIGEILALFKYWCKTNNSDIPTTIMSLSTFYENEIIKLLRHFYPNIKIVDNKFIQNIQCTLWNKNKDIDSSLEELKTTYKKQNKDVIIDFSDAYYFYAVYVSKLNNGKSKANVEINDGDTELEFTMDGDDEHVVVQESEHNMKHIVVNKRYFEEYLKFSLSNCIVFDNFISTEWYSIEWYSEN
jgi:hypothetical protein